MTVKEAVQANKTMNDFFELMDKDVSEVKNIIVETVNRRPEGSSFKDLHNAFLKKEPLRWKIPRIIGVSLGYRSFVSFLIAMEELQKERMIKEQGSVYYPS